MDAYCGRMAVTYFQTRQSAALDELKKLAKAALIPETFPIYCILAGLLAFLGLAVTSLQFLADTVFLSRYAMAAGAFLLLGYLARMAGVERAGAALEATILLLTVRC